MSIQWFPGHMTKAMRTMQEAAKTVDAFGYVLDARAPASCFNPEFEKIVGAKPCVFILNKCDLADEAATQKWQEFLSRKAPTVRVSATASKDAGKIVSALEAATQKTREKHQAKGVYRPVRCMIIGVPNCGKSTIINCLAGRKTVVTGDRPGVTKGKQWVRLKNGLELLDTPGTLWPKFEDQQKAYRLCFIGSIKDDVTDGAEVAKKLLAAVWQLYPQSISSRYGFDFTDEQQAFAQVAARRGFLLRGGEIDEERTAKAVADDFRKGKLGRITLEQPEEV